MGAVHHRLHRVEGVGILYTYCLLFAFGSALVLIRPLAIAHALIRHPRECFREIPSNWKRIALATDSFFPPGFVPGLDEGIFNVDSRSASPAGFKRFLEAFAESRGIHKIPGILLGLLLYTPAIFYRFSLKSTSLFYIPLLLIVGDHSSPNLHEQLSDLVGSEIEKLKRWYSGFILIFLTLAPTVIYFVLNAWWVTIEVWLKAHISGTALGLSRVFLFTTPKGIELDSWHVARSVNATLTLGMFIYAKEQLRKRKTASALPPSHAIDMLFLVRELLTIWVILCTVYVVVTTVDWNALPPIHVRIFPW